MSLAGWLTRARSTRRTLVVALSTLMLSGAALIGSAAAAPADPVAARGCQAPSAAFKLYGSNWTIVLKCSGTHTIKQTAQRFEAGGWSGVVYYGTQGSWAFCDGERWNFPYYTRSVVLYATRAPWC